MNLSFNISEAEEDFDTRFMDYLGNRFIFYGAQHISRYLWVSRYVKNKDVFDAGCGTGYGVDILSRNAHMIVGVDLSEKAISYAKNRYKKANIKFQTGDLSLGFEMEQKFDVVVSFEVLEHIREVDNYLKTLIKLLNDNGILIIGTPNSSFRNKYNFPWDSFHVKEYSPEELKNLLSSCFDDVKIHGQNIINEHKKKDFIKEIAARSLIESRGPLKNITKKICPFWFKAFLKILRLVFFIIIKPRKIFFIKDIEFSDKNLEEAFALIAICKSKNE